MPDSYLGLGSNIGDKRAHIERAIERIAAFMTVRRVSSFYETAPVGYLDQDWFLNCAIEVETARTARELAPLLLGLELEMGRRRELPGGPRTIDVDILFHGSEVIDEEGFADTPSASPRTALCLGPANGVVPGSCSPRNRNHRRGVGPQISGQAADPPPRPMKKAE